MVSLWFANSESSSGISNFISLSFFCSRALTSPRFSSIGGNPLQPNSKTAATYFRLSNKLDAYQNYRATQMNLTRYYFLPDLRALALAIFLALGRDLPKLPRQIFPFRLRRSPLPIDPLLLRKLKCLR